jgi:hypothetical protein
MNYFRSSYTKSPVLDYTYYYKHSISGRTLAVICYYGKELYFASVQYIDANDGSWKICNYKCTSLEEANKFIIDQLKLQDYHLIPPELEILI